MRPSLSFYFLMFLKLHFMQEFELIATDTQKEQDVFKNLATFRYRSENNFIVLLK